MDKKIHLAKVKLVRSVDFLNIDWPSSSSDPPMEAQRLIIGIAFAVSIDL
jgi:hypothetical protein